MKYYIPNINKKTKILSEDGVYYDFDGFIVSEVDSIMELYFDNESFVECTEDHVFYVNGKLPITATKLRVGDKLKTSSNKTKTLIYKSKRKENTLVYDPVNVGPTHTIYANDTLASQCVVLDEYAHVPNGIAEEFFTSVYPVISSGKESKLIVLSTPSGLNHYYKLFTDAKAKRNDYSVIDIHWTDIPGRDEEWKKEYIRNTSLKNFKQEIESLDKSVLVSIIDNGVEKEIPIGELYNGL